jgi:hypothetical protein
MVAGNLFCKGFEGICRQFFPRRVKKTTNMIAKFKPYFYSKSAVNLILAKKCDMKTDEAAEHIFSSLF